MILNILLALTHRAVTAIAARPAAQAAMTDFRNASGMPEKASGGVLV